MRFQILSLSGGGYRGLFTIELLSLMEKQAGRPIGSCFDLIAGTSIGGIIAIGLTMGKTAEQIKAVFMRNGEDIFPARPAPRRPPLKYLDLYRSLTGGPRYDGKALRTTVEGVVGIDTLIGDARTRLIVPAVNMTAGKLQMFKTPHHPNLTVDQTRSAVDVAMATSAAPLYFPLAKVGNSMYADGGLAANSPDACAIHEAIYFCGQARDDLHVLSIGTTSAGFGLPSSLGSDFGALEWVTNNRLTCLIHRGEDVGLRRRRASCWACGSGRR